MSEYHFTKRLENDILPEDILWVPGKYYYTVEFRKGLIDEIIIKYSSDLAGEFKIFSVIPADSTIQELTKEIKSVLSGWSPEQETILQKYIEIYAKEDFPYDISSFILYSDSSKGSSIQIKKKDTSNFDYEEGLDIELDYLYLCFLQNYEDEEYLEASKFITKLYHECAVRLGNDHPNTIAALWFIRAMIPRNDEKGLALIPDLKIYNYAVHRFGNNKTPTLYVILSIAMDLSDIGEFTDAMELAKYALERCKERYGEPSKEVLEAKNILGIIYHNIGSYGMAQKLFEECSKDSETVNGKLAFSTLVYLEKNADELCNEALSLYKEAAEIFLRIYYTLKEVYADDIYSIIIITDKLASAFLNLEDYGNASNYQQDAIELATAHLDIDDDLVLMLYSHFSTILSEMGEHETAYKIDINLYLKYFKKYGEFNYHTLNAMDSIIIDCYHQKNYAQAKELAFEAYIKRKEVLGPEHDKTLISQQQYLDLLDKI